MELDIFGYNVKEPPEQRFSTLEELVDYVDSKLTKKCKYFIAGGSCSEIYYNKTYSSKEGENDIDVFFETSDDFDNFMNSLVNDTFVTETINAITLEVYPEMPIQAIKIRKGKPHEILKTFDINKSRIGITADKEVIIDESIHKNLFVDYKNFMSSTPKRIIKYQQRGHEVPDTVLYEALMYIGNVFEVIDGYTGKEADKLSVISTMLHRYMDVHKDKSEELFYEAYKIVQVFIDDDYEKWLEFFDGFTFRQIDFLTKYDYYCIALVRKYPLDTVKLILDSQRYDEIRSKNPEEFI